MKFFKIKTRGLNPLLALLVKPRSKGQCPLRTMLVNSHSFSVNINHILIRFVFMRDQEKKEELKIHICITH